ncbi:MAG: putative lipid II flippase FtsW [Candidatus Gracilibacteria bacterium]|jgi:cell division protein FtsW|nr:putative lipid II flippase FtsW [Candidatus Gracilibacteria bacterium]
MNFEKIDRWLFFTIIGLVIFGVVMISSVSTYESFNLMVKIHGQEYCAPETGNNCNSFYLVNHIIRVILSLGLFFLGIFAPVKFYKKIAPGFFLLSWILLVSLFIKGIGSDYGTAKSWIDVPFLPSIQPSEIMKLAIIFYFALWLERKEKEVKTFEGGFLPFVILLSLALAPIALQPDFGSVLVIGAISVCMLIVAGGRFLHIVTGGTIASLIAWPIILSHDYIRDRFLAFLHPDSNSPDMQDALFQIKQSLIAVGSGKFWGVGVGESGQRNGWLPEIQGDTIFAAAAEELGFIRIAIFIGAFFLIAYRGLMIGEKTNDRFLKLVAVGITSWVVCQALINICVTIALMPLTGITLPFISYGGTSLLMMMFASGILLNISMERESGRFFYKKSRLK